MPAKLLLMLLAQKGCIPFLRESIAAEARILFEKLPPSDRSVTAMIALDEDPLATRDPARPVFDATLELSVSERNGGCLIEACEAIGVRLKKWTIPMQSTALLGTDKVIVRCEPMPIRYQYLMRRRADHTREQYFDHYTHRHARFGRQTGGIRGYVQFHVDAAASRALADRAGLGLCPVDSVSQLHMETLEGFLAAIARNPAVGEAAITDEESFVDRESSRMFTSRVIVRLADRPEPQP